MKRKGARNKYDWVDFPYSGSYDVAVYGGVVASNGYHIVGAVVA